MLEKRNAAGRESLWFSSLSYLKEGENLPAIIPSVVYADLPDVCSGVVLFDLWVANCDRHDKNLSFDPNVTPKRLNVFDHSHALFGIEGPARLTRLQDKFTLTEAAESGANRHCLVDQLTDAWGFQRWHSRIVGLPNFQIVDACKNAQSLGLIDDADGRLLLEFLLRRRRILRDLIQDNWRAFPAMTTNPLF
jgi:hypothetical protein